MESKLKKVGKPKKWTPELVKEYKEKILHEIGENGLSLRKTFKLEGFPSQPVVLDWLKVDKDFSTQYAHACARRADKIADEILEICDATENDIVVDSEGNEITNHNVIQRDRLRVDTRKWLMGKLNPKKYGDSMKLSGDEENPVNISVLNLPDFMKKD